MLKKIITNRIFTYSLLLVAISVLFIIPEHLLFDNKYSVCMHKMILGIECSLCGMTRAGYELIHFRFASAFQYNFTIFLLVLYIASDLFFFAFPGKLIFLVRKIVLISFISGLVVLYIIRVGKYFAWF
jgi:hypothetical protein